MKREQSKPLRNESSAGRPIIGKLVMKKLLLLGIFLANSYSAIVANVPVSLATSSVSGDRSQMKEETVSPFLPNQDSDPIQVSGLSAGSNAFSLSRRS